MSILKAPHAAALGGIMLMGIASSSLAQSALDPLLPVMRAIDHPPPVTDVGKERRSDGGVVSSSRPAFMAIADLQRYAAQLETRFPPSGDEYPADSLHQARVQRAREWVARLHAEGQDVSGAQLLDVANVAMYAEQDSLAGRLVDARLAELPAGQSGALVRSEALASAMLLFADTKQDSARLARNIPRAEQYAARLLAISAGGYRTRTDSTDVLYRKLQGAQTILLAAIKVGDFDRVKHYTDQTFSIVDRLSFRERILVVQKYPYTALATALLITPNGRARLDTVEQALIAHLTPRLLDGTAEERAQYDAMGAGMVGTMRDLFAWIGLIGHPAPPVSAHVWFNTPDSMYADTPRTHSFADGIVRVLAFDHNQSSMLPMLDRLQRRLPKGVQVLLVTNINGYVGPDLKTPVEEAAWLGTYYHTIRPVTVPIALWAGAKAPAEYGWLMPIPPPTDESYHASRMLSTCVLIDGADVIREYLNAASREDEARIVQRATLLLHHQ